MVATDPEQSTPQVSPEFTLPNVRPRERSQPRSWAARAGTALIAVFTCVGAFGWHLTIQTPHGAEWAPCADAVALALGAFAVSWGRRPLGATSVALIGFLAAVGVGTIGAHWTSWLGYAQFGVVLCASTALATLKASDNPPAHGSPERLSSPARTGLASALAACALAVVLLAGFVTGGPNSGPVSTRQSPIVSSPPTETTVRQDEALPIPTWLASCEHLPGEGLALDTLRYNQMVAAINFGASPAFGCLRDSVTSSDGTFVQPFAHEHALLMITEHGAGVASYPNSNLVEKISAGNVEAATLGVDAILDRFDCFGKTGDMQGGVDVAGHVELLLVRRNKVELIDGSSQAGQAIVVAPEMLGIYSERLNAGHVLVPLAEAARIDGSVSQMFIDPGDETVGAFTLSVKEGSSTGPAPALADLFRACNPGLDLPDALRVP